MDDLISRAAALDAIDLERKVLIEQSGLGAEHVVVHHAQRLIEELPAVDAVPVEWLQAKSKELRAMGEYQNDCADCIWFVLKLWEMEKEGNAHE